MSEQELPASALVVGLARQGRAAAVALARRGVRVVGVDRSDDLDVSELEESGVDIRLGAQPEVPKVEVVVKSGGVPNDVAAALGGGAPIWSDVEVASRILSNPFLGVTGTNGKTTTCALLGAIFGTAGRDAAVAGNIGYAVCALDGEIDPDAWIICELSSFQLEWIAQFRARTGVLINFEADHLDRHVSLDSYAAAKLRLFENQTNDDVAVIPRGFRAIPGNGRRVEFDSADDLPAEPLIRGAHNRENAVAATAAARAVGIADDAIAQALTTFPGVPHRLEEIRTIDGVLWVNDSKATNVAAARRALAAYEAPFLLILGGSLKGEDFGPLVGAIPHSVRSILLIGEAADELAAALDRAGRAYERAGDLETAVHAAAARAMPGDVVLLSPACASYDQFENFEQRGDAFRRLVDALSAR